MILADGPAASLDRGNADRLVADLLACERGRTAIAVSHDSAVLRAMDRMIEVIDGMAQAWKMVGHLWGQSFAPLHGHGDFGEGAHGGVGIEVVGRMAPSGSPWDRAILTPIENVWTTHGLTRGHAPGESDRIGLPFDSEYFPSAPAFLLHADEVWANHAAQAADASEEMMAFLPGAALARLHALLGESREIMSLMAVLTQALGVLAWLVVLARRSRGRS